MKIDDFFKPMKVSGQGIGTEYDKIQEEYFSMFGHNVPRSLLPDAMSDDEIISAMKACIFSKKDNLFEVLGVTISDDYLY